MEYRKRQRKRQFRDGALPSNAAVPHHSSSKDPNHHRALPTRNIVSNHPRRGRPGASINLFQAPPAKSTIHRRRHSHDPPRTPRPSAKRPERPRIQGIQARSFRPTPPFPSATRTAEFSFPQTFALQSRQCHSAEIRKSFKTSLFEQSQHT